MSAACPQRAYSYQSSFTGCSGHKESIQIIVDEKSNIFKRSKIGPTWPRNLWGPIGAEKLTLLSIFKPFAC